MKQLDVTRRIETFASMHSTRDDELGDTTYFGVADDGVDDSEARWAIKRYKQIGNVIYGQMAVPAVQGNHYSNVWSDRASLTYK